MATTDLLRDPDETRIADGSAAADATDAARSAHLAHRMRCCLDRWWQPAGVPAEPNCVRDFGGKSGVQHEIAGAHDERTAALELADRAGDQRQQHRPQRIEIGAATP